MKNLQEIWTVQRMSGHDSVVCKNKEEAETLRTQWDEEIQTEFEAWVKSGSSSSDIFSFQDGKPYIPSTSRPVIHHYSPGELDYDRWAAHPEHPDLNKVVWG